MIRERIELVGDWHEKTLRRCRRIVKYQFKNNVKNGIKGFLFYGTPGTGKTTLAKALLQSLVRELVPNVEDYSYEKHYQILDCADLAHAKYGETERRIRKVFYEGKEQAQAHDGGFQIYLFDDADGLFITRDYGTKLEAWYIGQLNVFFHVLDDLDSSKEVVVLTTNRIDLMDRAIKDRLLPIEFPSVSRETLVARAKQYAQEFKFEETMIKEICEKIKKNNAISTFRQVEQLVLDNFINYIDYMEEE